MSSVCQTIQDRWKFSWCVTLANNKSLSQNWCEWNWGLWLMSTICATHTQTQCYEDKRKAQQGNKWVQSRGIQIGVRQRSAGGITLVGKQREPHHLIASSECWLKLSCFVYWLWHSGLEVTALIMPDSLPQTSQWLWHYEHTVRWSQLEKCIVW